MDDIKSVYRTRVNGAVLPKFHGKQVCVLGTIVKVYIHFVVICVHNQSWSYLKWLVITVVIESDVMNRLAQYLCRHSLFFVAGRRWISFPDAL